MKGLIGYNISRTDGKELDPNDKYIVIRYTGKDDWGVLGRRALDELCYYIIKEGSKHELYNFVLELKADIEKARLETYES